MSARDGWASECAAAVSSAALLAVSSDLSSDLVLQ